MSRNSFPESVSLLITGPVKSAQLNYNAEGKSKGVATVVFTRHGDAAKALSEYNGRKLDDRPMRIELIVNPEAPQLQKLGPKPTKVTKKPTRGGPRRGRGGRTPKAPVDASQLDAEMDAYMNVTLLILGRSQCCFSKRFSLILLNKHF